MRIEADVVIVGAGPVGLFQIFELGQDEAGQFYIAMELVNGLNLRQLNMMCAEKGILIPPELAAYMMTQALDGLEYAHNFRVPDGKSLNLVHRDISPQNIFIDYEGTVKVLDFGIAQAADRITETDTGLLKGKFAYMSPEQLNGLPVDRRADIWSLGVVLWEAITGQRLFRARSEGETAFRIVSAEIPPMGSVRPDVPAGGCTVSGPAPPSATLLLMLVIALGRRRAR